MVTVGFRSLQEEGPGPAWNAVFQAGWPGWRRWFLDRGGAEAPSLGDAERALRRFMPEVESLWSGLVAAVSADEDAARFLSFWTPPRYLIRCSQAVLVDADGPVLVRNYDLAPELNEGTLLRTHWRHRDVMGMVDALSGLADGMNDAGLVVSLTFGGRTVAGRGFGAPMIVRYLLEVCSDTHQAVEALRAVPCHMAYNVTILDRQGLWETVYLSPDRPAIVTGKPFTTNHQLGVEWPRHGRLSRTMERAAVLERILADPALDGERLAAAFLVPPLQSTSYSEGFGTVYTACYRPASGSVTLQWPDHQVRHWSFQDYEQVEFGVSYPD